MGNRLPSDTELDALIEAALQDEPMLPVPPGMHGRIQERVYIASLQERERVRFRYSLLSALGALAVILFGTVTVVTLTHFSFIYQHGVSGGKGFVDYYLTLFDVSWSSRVGAYALGLAMGLSATLLWGGLLAVRGPFRRAH